MTGLSKITGRRGPILAGAALAGLLALAAFMFWLPRPSGRADPGDPQQVAHGHGVYREHCARCHGARLEGQPNWRIRKPDGRLPAPPHDMSGHTWHHSDEQLFLITKHGLRPPVAPEGYESDMPAYAGSLSDADIWAVLAYIKSTWPPDIRARQNLRNQPAPSP